MNDIVSSLRVSVPSPTSSSLGKFGDIPVLLYTGTPQIEIPLHTAKGRTLELPISLRYHASGSKVEEIAGWVGLGWALDTGGVITRVVPGLPDDKHHGYYETAGEIDELWNNWPPSESILQLYLSKV